MHKRVKKTAGGFTLIELLVVMIIITIVLAAAALAMNFSSRERVVKEKTALLAASLRTAVQEAILLPATLGLKIDVQGYQFKRFEQGKWQKLSADALSQPLAFTQGIHATLKLKDKNEWLVISKNGELQPFTIDLRAEHSSVVYRITLNDSGAIVWSRESYAQ